MIKKIAKELHYFPNASAYSLRKKMNRSISLVVPQLSFAGGEFFQEVIRGIDKITESNNYTLIFSKYDKNDNSFYRIIKEKRIDGAIVFGDIFSLEELSEMDTFQIPIVIVNYKLSIAMNNLIDIYSDNEKGGEIAAEHFINKHNRKKILYIGGGNKYQASILRYKGFSNIAKKYNIKTDIINANFEDGFNDGKKIIQDLINDKKFIYDAIFAASDNIGIGALSSLISNQINVPTDVSLIGYDNTQITNYFPVTITSVEQNAYQLGLISAETIFKKISQKDTPNKSIRIEPEIKIRHSCGC